MMMNFGEVVSQLWPKALRTIQDWNDVENDKKVFKALRDRKLPTRRDDLREWLRNYAVFQGFTGAQRDQIAEAVLFWADCRNPCRDLTTPEALASAHAELMEHVCQAWLLNKPDAKNRSFTSLASKALWLCYPDSVPIFDRYAADALHFISKIEDGISPIPEKGPDGKKKPDYEQFVHVWKQLYGKYKETIESLDIGAYPYRVKVLDRVLWLVGRPAYSVDWTTPNLMA